MCQCPVSGYPHFYEVPSQHFTQKQSDVSMPCLGLSPFLHGYKKCKGNHQQCVNALSRAIPISTAERKPLWIQMNVSMPCLGLSPFLQQLYKGKEEMRYVSMPCLGLSPFLRPKYRYSCHLCCVSMPCLGLSPFLRSPLGTRINRGHNLETIHVIVRQFSFAPIFTPFFPSPGISALFHLKWFVSRHFYYTCFFIPAQGIFAFLACFSISVSWPLIFPFP